MCVHACVHYMCVDVCALAVRTAVKAVLSSHKVGSGDLTQSGIMASAPTGLVISLDHHLISLASFFS